MGTADQLAGYRQTCPVRPDALLGLHVVVVIGRALPPSDLGCLEGRPSQDGCSLFRELAGGSLLVGLGDGDIEPSVAHRLPRAAKAPGISEFREYRHAG